MPERGHRQPGDVDVAPVITTTRALTAGDAPLLREATWTNMNWTGEQRFTYRDIDAAPDVRHYFDPFRPERGDFGVVAERDGLAVGIVWLLFLLGHDRGYGHVADDVPELSVCVWSGYRGEGVGGGLLRAALAEARTRGLRRVSLSVEPENPAARLYRRAGFRDVPSAAEGTMAVEP